MPYLTIPVTPFEQNCSLLWCEQTRAAALIDAGGEAERLLAAVAQHDLRLEKLLLTHAHLDHCGAALTLSQRLGIPIIGPHQGDAFWLAQLPEQAQSFGFPPAAAFTPDQWLNDGDTVQVGETVLEVLHCPGHTPGHVVFFDRAEGVAFVGDVLFAGSIGRTDFPQGNHADLIRAIRDKLFPLGDAVRFVPGHGPESTFGRERDSNPYVGDATLGRA
jgi:hydroxyacylglutathione hydrolase